MEKSHPVESYAGVNSGSGQLDLMVAGEWMDTCLPSREPGGQQGLHVLGQLRGGLAMPGSALQGWLFHLRLTHWSGLYPVPSAASPALGEGLETGTGLGGSVLA